MFNTKFICAEVLQSFVLSRNSSLSHFDLAEAEPEGFAEGRATAVDVDGVNLLVVAEQDLHAFQLRRPTPDVLEAEAGETASPTQGRRKST